MTWSSLVNGAPHFLAILHYFVIELVIPRPHLPSEIRDVQKHRDALSPGYRVPGHCLGRRVLRTPWRQ